MSVEFLLNRDGFNWEIEEALAPPVMAESIPEPTNPANTIVSVVAAPVSILTSYATLFVK
jgi:hypothetical protein